MTTYFVTRHPEAVTWAEARDIEVDRIVSHLDPTDVEPGDTVIGTLPVNLAADVCSRGGTYLHLSLDVPPDFRGRELTVDQMDGFGAIIERFEVTRR